MRGVYGEQHHRETYLDDAGCTLLSRTFETFYDDLYDFDSAAIRCWVLGLGSDLERYNAGKKED